MLVVGLVAVKAVAVKCKVCKSRCLDKFASVVPCVDGTCGLVLNTTLSSDKLMLSFNLFYLL